MSPSRPATTSEAEPALGATRPADVTDALLADALAGTRPEVLVVFGAGGGVTDLVTASEARRVIIADRNVVHIHAAAEAVRGIPQASAVVSEGLSHLEPGLRADAVALRVPREKQPALQLIWDAYQVLRPGGRLYVAGAVRDGVKSSMRHVSDLFGGMQPLAMRKGSRVGAVTRADGEGVRPKAFASEFFDHNRYHSFAVTTRGHTYEVHSRPGVFAWDRLDGGTSALIEAMQVTPGDRVLDLGCGYGIVGAVAANLGAGHVTMVDADIVAVESARRTVAANRLRRLPGAAGRWRRAASTATLTISSR